MKLTYSIVYIFLLSGLFISCQENECVLGQETDKPTGTDRTVDLVFSFSGEQTATRTFNEGIATEEGKVKSLIYAVFRCRKYKLICNILIFSMLFPIIYMKRDKLGTKFIQK